MSFLELAGIKKDKPNDNHRILIFGPPFSGKTAFALSYPKPFLFDGEDNAKWFHQGAQDQTSKDDELLPWVNPPVESKRFKSAAEALKLIRLMYNTPRFFSGDYFDTFIVDPVTAIWDRAVAEYDEMNKGIDKNLKNEDIFKGVVHDFNDWNKIKNPFKILTIMLDQMNVHRIYLAHAKTNFKSVIKTKYGRSYETKEADGSKASGIGDLDYHVDTSIEMLDPEDIRRKHIPKSVYSVGLVHKDRTHAFKRGDLVENPRFDLWKGHLSHIKREPTNINSVTRSPKEEEAIELCLANVKIQELAEKIGMTEPQLIKGIVKYNCDPDAVIKALEAKED